VAENPQLNNEEIKRYSRHLIMPEVGMDGQRRLKAGSVLCIGAGGLGSPAAMYLAAAGVGRIGLVDYDVVDFSNLQRQIIHGTPDVGRSKLASAKDRINAINPHVHVETYEVALSSENALQLFKPYDVILDGTDNFPTRYLTNDACVLLGKPNAYGSIFRFEGQASVFAMNNGPCYRCLYPEPPPPGLVPRRAWRSARDHRRHPGDGSHQADYADRRTVDRPFPHLRRAQDEIPGAEAEERSRVPGLRRASDDHEAH
jgi:adenylyltransferase/sulfurtransferase